MFAKARHPLPEQSKFANMENTVNISKAIRPICMILVTSQIVIGAFDFGPSNALAQTTAVCSNTPNTGERIECTESAGSTTTIDIDLEGYIVDTTEVGEHGIYAKHEGDGDIEISLEPHIDPNNLITTTNDICTAGRNAHGIFDHHTGDGDITINADAVDIKTQGPFGHGIYSWQSGSVGDTTINANAVDIETHGDSSDGIQSYSEGEGETRVVVNNAKIDTEGYSADGVEAWRDGAGGSYGKVYIDISDSEITTNGNYARAIYGRSTAPIVLDYENDLTIDIRDSTFITNGHSAAGIAALPYTSGLLHINLDNVNRAQSGNPRHPFLRHLGR